MDINKIKIMMLETKCQDFLNCSSKFLTDKYELFLNSYLTKCEDSRIKRMASKLDEKYLLIKKGYQNISEWWNNYLENVKGLEQSLAQNRNETMTEGDLITYVSKNIESLNSFEENISTLLSPALIKDVSPIVDTFQGHMSNFQTMSTSVLGTNLGLNAFSFGAIAWVSTNHEKTAKNSDSDPITNQAFVHSFNMAATNANFSSNANSVLNLKSVSNSAIASDSAISSTLNLSFSKEGEKSLNSSELNDQILFQSMGGFSLAASSAAFSFRSALASQSSPATRDSEKKDSFSKTSSPTATDDKKKNVSSDSGDMATVIDDSSLAGIVRQSFSGEDWESAFERNLESAKIMSKACDVTIKDLKKQQDELQKSLDSFLLGHGYILRTEFYRPDDSIDSVKALTPEEYEKRLLNSIDYDIPDSDPEIGYNVIKRQEKAKKKALEYAIKFNEAFEKRMGISYNDYLEQLQSIENDIATIKFSKYSFDQQVKMSPYLSIMYSETFQEYKDGYNPLGEYELDKVGLFKKQNPIRYCEKLDTKFVSVNEDMVDSVLANSNLESYERFTLLSEDEKALYSFLYDEKGYKEAENYLKAMEDTLNNRQGLKEAVDFINGISDVKISVDYISPTAQQDFLKALDGVDVGDKWYSFFSTVGKGFGDGLQTFGEGFSSILSSKGMISTNQYAQMYILEGFSKDWFLTGTYEVSTSAGNMAPSIALSAAATAAAGPAGLGLSAETAATVGSTMGYISTGFSVFGNAKNQALVNGNSLASSTLYATCSGVSEVALGKLLGNIGILNENAKFALQEILNEGIEEGLQEFVDAGLRTAFLNEDVDINQLVGDSGKSFLYGVIMSTITTGGQQAIRIVAGGKAHTISSSDAVELLELLNNVEEANQKDAVLEYLTNVKNKGNVEISSPATTVVEKVSFADKVKNLSLNLFDSLGQTASTVFNGVVSVNHKINDLRTKVADNMVDTGAKVVNGVKSVFAKTSNVAESVFDTYMNFRSDVQDSVKDVTLDVIDSVVDTKVSEFEQVTTLLDTTKGSVANLLQVDVQPEDSIGTTFDTFFENVNTNISEILHSRISLPKMFIGMFYSSFGVLSKLVYTPVKNNGEMSKTILEDGIYHITSLENAQKILESGYVKASNIISSYGSKKAFFFAGFPNFENVAVNIPSFLEKAVAIKFDIDEADLDNFRYRSLADQAVATIGDYVFDPAKASLVYLGLMNDNGKLVYKEISGDTYNGYHTDVSADFLGKRIVNLEKNLVALAREGGNVIHNVENLVQIIRKGDVTKTAAKIVVGAKNVVSSNLSDLEGRITSLIHDYQEKVSSIDQLGPTYEQLEKKKIFDLLNNAIEKQVNEPIKVLMDEYNNLLDSDSRLSELITKGNNGEVIRIPEELVESYLHLRDLEYRMLHPEISPKMEVKSFLLNQIKVKFNETFAKISEKPLSAWNNLKDIKVSNLFDVLKQTFLSNIDRNSQSYINQLNQVNRENNPINVGELKTGIIENMPQGLSELEQARYVYLELGKKLNFNKNFNMNDVENYAYMKGLYDLEITNDTNFDSGVICANWAVVYADMLNSLGISSHVAGEHRSLSHQWVEFEIDGHYFAADATRGSLTDLARISVGEQTQEFYEIYDYSTTSYPVAKPLENFDGYLRNVDAKLNYLHDFNYPNVVESVQSSSNSIDEGLLLLSDTVLSKLGFIEAKSYLLKYVRSLDTDKVSGTDLTKFFKNGQKDIVNITSVLQEDGTYKYYALHEGLGLQEVTTNDLNALIYSGYNLENGKSIKGYEYSSIHGIASRLNSLRNSINGKVASVFHSILEANSYSEKYQLDLYSENILSKIQQELTNVKAFIANNIQSVFANKFNQKSGTFLHNIGSRGLQVGTGVVKIGTGVSALLASSFVHPILTSAMIIPTISLMHSGILDINGNVIKNSFLVNMDGKRIHTPYGYKKVSVLLQNCLAYGDIFKSRFIDNKPEYFMLRSLNALQYLQTGKIYGTVSQPYTLFLLRKAKKLGLIENLTVVKSKVKTSLPVERFLMGVEQRDKKIDMYEITFNLTGEPLTKSAIDALLKGVDLSKYSVKVDRAGHYLFDVDLSSLLKSRISETYQNAFLSMKEIVRNTASVVSNHFRDFSNTIMPFVLLKDSQDVGDLATGTHVTNKSYTSLVDEFNQLIDSDSRLSWLLEEHDAGKTVQVPAELSETYQRLIQLKTLIENSVGASEVEEKLPNIDLNEVPDNLADFNKYMYYIRSLTDKNVPEGFSTIEEYKRAFARSIRDSGKLDQYANINYVLHLTYDPIILSELIGTEKVSELYCKLKQVPQIFADPLSKLSFEDFDRLFSDETVKKSILDLDVQDFQKIIKAFSEKELSSWLTQDTFLQKLFSLDDAAIKDVLLTSSQLYSQLSAEDFNRIFNDEHVRDVVLNMNLEEFKQIISSFNFRTVSTWLVNETMVDKVMRLSVNDFYDLMNSINYSSVDNFLESNLDFTQYERLLKSILEKFYTEDVLLQDMQYEMLIGNIIHLNMDMDSKIKQYCQQINQVTKQAENVLNEKFSNCLAPNLNRIIPVANGYYTITLKIDGKLETVPTLVMNDKIDLYRFMLRSSQYSTALLKNNLKILSVVPDERKTNLTVFDGTVNEGLHEIVLLLDGQEYRMIYNNLYGNLDLSYMADYEFKDISDIQIKQIIPLPSYSQEVDHPGVYLLKYDVNGKTFSRYLATINKDGKNILDVDQYIEKNQLIGISNVRVEEVSLNEIKDIFPKIDSFTNVFGAKYGGNQSDVAQLVEDYVGRRDLSMIEQQKAQLLNSLIEKYFPDATDLQKVNLAEFYASGGCCWMAVANAFATYMGNKDDDGISFKNKIGFDLFYMDGDQKVYNLEAIAFDMFLNYYSKEYDHINDILENETSSGIAIVDFQAKIIDYFEERNIIAQYLNNFVNNKMDALSTILDFSNYFSILLGNHFDLKQISDDFNITHNKDKALSKSTVDGQISKDVGSHAMLITDINENLDLIVSSWSKKYEFLFDSLQEYKDRHSYANILSLIFYETD